MKYFQSFNELLIKDLNKDNIKLGGEGKIVEIDESKFARVKHWKGKDMNIKLIWVFGMKERNSRRCYFEVSLLFYIFKTQSQSVKMYLFSGC